MAKLEKMAYEHSVNHKDLTDIHTNHNSKKITILNQFLEVNIAIAIR